MKKPTLIVAALIIAVAISVGFNAFQATQTNTQATTKLEMVTKITQAQVQINSELQTLSNSVATAAKQLRTTGLAGEQARQIIAELAQSSPYVIDASTINLACTFITVEPATYSSLEGNTTQFPYNMFTTSTDPIQTILSGPYTLTEGPYGAVIMAPIFNPSGNMIGSVSVAFDQSALINTAATAACAGTPYVIWASNLNGTMIYEVSAYEVGTNLYSDYTTATWTSLHTFAHQMTSQTAGYGTYEYENYQNTGKTVTKQAYWATIGIYNTEWRLVITNVMS